MTEPKKLQKKAVVLGAGPGGYVAAIRLAQLGVETAIVDKAYLGGVCLNVGCIPSKALIHASKLVSSIQGAGAMGVNVGKLSVDLEKMVEWKDGIVERLTTGIGTLLKKRKVEILMGEGRFAGSRELEVTAADGARTLVAFEHAIVATGSRPIQVPGFEFDGEKVLTSTDALSLTSLPRSLVVIGGGVIGLEIGTVLAKFGTELTVVEMMDQLLPGTDKELVDVVARELKKKKVALHLSSKATKLEKTKKGVKVEGEGPGGAFSVEAELLLVTVGRRPNTENLGLEAAGVKTTRGFIEVNEKMETSAKGIYAIGDVSGPPLLAHKASKEGMVAAERIAGKPSVADWKAMPAATFTDPEVATTGLQESEARAKGIEVTIGRFPYQASGRALSTNQAFGLVKVIADKKTGIVLGAGIVGAEASELVAELTLAVEMGAHLEDLALTVHAHPTMAEMTMEAAEAALGHPIHVPG